MSRTGFLQKRAQPKKEQANVRQKLIIFEHVPIVRKNGSSALELKQAVLSKHSSSRRCVEPGTGLGRRRHDDKSPADLLFCASGGVDAWSKRNPMKLETVQGSSLSLLAEGDRGRCGRGRASQRPLG